MTMRSWKIGNGLDFQWEKKKFKNFSIQFCKANNFFENCAYLDAIIDFCFHTLIWKFVWKILGNFGKRCGGFFTEIKSEKINSIFF